MKAKNNLELFKNKIMYKFKHHPQKRLWDIMGDIYRREKDKKMSMYPQMLNIVPSKYSQMSSDEIMKIIRLREHKK